MDATKHRLCGARAARMQSNTYIIIVLRGVWKVWVHNQFWAVGLDHCCSSRSAEDVAQVSTSLQPSIEIYQQIQDVMLLDPTQVAGNTVVARALDCRT